MARTRLAWSTRTCFAACTRWTPRSLGSYRIARCHRHGARWAGTVTGKTPYLETGIRLTAEDKAAALAAVRESVQLALEAEGPSGGPFAAQYLNAAWRYYDVSYSSFPPAMLAIEVHRTRALVTAMLRAPQPDGARTELHRVGGWLSALRLRGLDQALARTRTADSQALSLAERIRTLPGLTAVGQVSDEPNGR